MLISHRRREETLPLSAKDEQFCFDYELALTFSADMHNFYAVNLRIVDLKFIEPVNPKFKSTISRLLGYGSLVL